MPAVLIIDDDPRVRAAAAALVSASGRFTLAGEAGSAAQGIAMARALCPEVLLLDLGLPDGDGTQVLEALREQAAPPAAIVLTVFDDDAHVFDALRAGALGYLLKDDLIGRVLGAIDEVLAGGSPMSPSIARRVLRTFARPTATPPEVALTDRELEVTELLAHGSTYAEIGEMLGISTNTVRSFIRSIYDKLHVCSKTEAVREATRRGLLRD